MKIKRPSLHQFLLPFSLQQRHACIFDGGERIILKYHDIQIWDKYKLETKNSESCWKKCSPFMMMIYEGKKDRSRSHLNLFLQVYATKTEEKWKYHWCWNYGINSVFDFFLSAVEWNIEDLSTCCLVKDKMPIREWIKIIPCSTP